jgi:hypothetical protein
MAAHPLTLAELARANGSRVYGGIVVPPGGRLTLEQIVCHPDAFGLTTATPVQRAIYRVSDGLPLGDLWDREDVREAFGHVKPPEEIPGTFAIFSGIRGYKSGSAAARCLQATQECDLSTTRTGDIISIPCLSITKERAADVFQHLARNVQEKPALRKLLAGPIKSDSLVLRHPSGRLIEVVVTAIAKYGATLVGRWLAGLILDEAPRMAGEADGVRNLEQSLLAVAGRMLPGSSIWVVGSPHAPTGPAYEMDRKYFGAPADGIVVVRAPGPSLNPSYWTPELTAKLAKENPDAHRTNCLAMFLDAAGAMFSLSAVEKATRPGELEPDPLCTYAAAIDPAARGNSFGLVITGRIRDDAGAVKDRIVLTRRWRPDGKTPLDLPDVFRQVAELCAPYGVKTVRSDQWAIDALRPIAQMHGLSIAEETITSTRKTELYESFRLRLERGEVEIIDDPVLRADLMRVRKVATLAGLRIESPTLADGSHGDMASACVLAFAYPLPDPRVLAPLHGTEAHWAEVVAKDKAAALDKAASMARKRWKRGGFRAIGG